jgi:hypothetical protein
VLKGLKTHVKAWLKILDVEFLPFAVDVLGEKVKLTALDLVVMSKKDAAKLVRKTVPFLARLQTLKVFFEIEFVFTIPFEMWMDFAQAQVEAVRFYYLKGRLTAFRQWLRELSHLARTRAANFPASIDIDLTQVLPSLEVYYIARYMNERSAESMSNDPAAVRLFATDFKEGFDDQVVQMPFLGEYLMQESDEVLAELARRSDLEPCKIELLHKLGIIDLSLARAQLIEQFADELLARLPPI